MARRAVAVRRTNGDKPCSGEKLWERKALRMLYHENRSGQEGGEKNLRRPLCLTLCRFRSPGERKQTDGFGQDDRILQDGIPFLVGGGSPSRRSQADEWG